MSTPSLSNRVARMTAVQDRDGSHTVGGRARAVVGQLEESELAS